MTPREAATELRWFFTEAEGDLGLKGVSLEPSGSEPGHQAAERRASRCVRWSEVSRRLDAIGTEHRRVLHLAYGPKPRSWPMGLARWYEEGPVAAMLKDREDVIGAARRLAKLTAKEGEPLRKKAKEVRKAALRAFVDAR